MKIRLIRDTSGIGDMIRCTAVASAIKAKHACHITMYASRHYAPYAKYCPEVDAVQLVEYNARPRDSDWRETFEAEDYDHTIDLYCPAFKYEREHAPDLGMDRIDIWTKKASEVLGENLEPCRPRVLFPKHVKRGAFDMLYRKHLMPRDMRKKLLWGVHANAASPLRSMPFDMLDKILWRVRDFGADIILIDHDVSVIDVAKRHNVHWACRVSPDYLWGLIWQLDGLLAVDSGPLHMAGALGIPTLGVFSTSEGNLICKHYPTVVAVNPANHTDLGCETHCYYCLAEEQRKECMKLERCEAMYRIHPDFIAGAVSAQMEARRNMSEVR